MDGFIKKLIGRLEEKVHSYYKQYMDDIIGYSTYNEHKREITGIIEIVNQLAEEYKPNKKEPWHKVRAFCRVVGMRKIDKIAEEMKAGGIE